MSEVLAAVDAGDDDAVVEALVGLEPRARRALAPQLFDLYRRYTQGSFRPHPDDPRTSSFAYEEGSDAQRAAVTLAVSMVATVAELRGKRGLPTLNDARRIPAAAARVRPPWLAPDDLEQLVEAEVLAWATVEGLVAAGVSFSPRGFPMHWPEGRRRPQPGGAGGDKPRPYNFRHTPAL